MLTLYTGVHSENYNCKTHSYVFMNIYKISEMSSWKTRLTFFLIREMLV